MDDEKHNQGYKMTLIQKIKDQQLIERKAQNSAAAVPLTTLIGEAEAIGKNNGRTVTDAEVVALLKKFVKNALETLSLAQTHGYTLQVPVLTAEIELFSQYLPRQMSEEVLTTVMKSIIIEQSIVSSKQMGLLMKNLKATYDGAYDGAMASRVSKQLLSELTG